MPNLLKTLKGFERGGLRSGQCEVAHHLWEVACNTLPLTAPHHVHGYLFLASQSPSTVRPARPRVVACKLPIDAEVAKDGHGTPSVALAEDRYQTSGLTVGHQPKLGHLAKVLNSVCCPQATRSQSRVHGRISSLLGHVAREGEIWSFGPPTAEPMGCNA